jgi:hypothetical protein
MAAMQARFDFAGGSGISSLAARKLAHSHISFRTPSFLYSYFYFFYSY